MTRTVKLTIGFEGTRYEGWQSQKKGNTVQEIFEKNLSRILKEKISIVGSSRTDSGVHALGLVAHFRTRNPLPDKKIKDALNFYLPRDIIVFSAKTVPDSFHARYSAKSKLYRYDIWRSPTRPLFQAPFVLWHPGPLDVPAMKKAAQHFVGKHDFAAFHDRGEEGKSTVREVHRLRIIQKPPLIRIEIQANGFLRHMVRVIVGTLIAVGRGKLLANAIPAILESKTRSKAGPTAKGYGLMLVSVKY